MRHVDLDPVGAVVELLPSGFARFDGSVDDLRTFGHVEFRRVAFEVVSAGGGDRARGAEETRAGDGAFGDGFANFDVAVAGPFGFDVAESGEALLECAAAGESGARGAECDSSFQDIG